jgi:hypothetical protein
MAQIDLNRALTEEGIVKKKPDTKCFLGDLIVALYEEAHKESLQSFEQKVVVYAALKHLLTQHIRGVKHSISLDA